LVTFFLYKVNFFCVLKYEFGIDIDSKATWTHKFAVHVVVHVVVVVVVVIDTVVVVEL